MKVCEIAKLLKPGMFVKIKITSDDTDVEKLTRIPLIGEIGKIEDGEFHVFNNTHDGDNTYLKEAREKGYIYSWCIDGVLYNQIEILDELPEDCKPHPKQVIKGKVCDLVDKLKPGMFVKVEFHSGKYLIGEIGEMIGSVIYIFNNTYNDNNRLLEEAIKKGYKFCYFIVDFYDNQIEILDELPEDCKPHPKQVIKGRVCDLVDKLKPGVFVRTRASSDEIAPSETNIIGKIGLIDEDAFYIFTNKIPEDTTGFFHFERHANYEEYKHVWCVCFNNQDEIEILDPLPEQEEDDDEDENDEQEELQEKLDDYIDGLDNDDKIELIKEILDNL